MNSIQGHPCLKLDTPQKVFCSVYKQRETMAMNIAKIQFMGSEKEARENVSTIKVATQTTATYAQHTQDA